jgi:Uncharacterized conserved protein (COG2071)
MAFEGGGVKQPCVFLAAEWNNLLMLNYAVDPALLQPFVPSGTELDTFDGRAYLSLNGFELNRTLIRTDLSANSSPRTIGDAARSQTVDTSNMKSNIHPGPSGKGKQRNSSGIRRVSTELISRRFSRIGQTPHFLLKDLT